MKILFTLCGLLCLSLTTSAQNFDYGKPEELMGLKKVFVDTGADTKSRDKIMKALQDAKLGFEVLDSEDGAEILLLYNAGIEKRLMGSANPSGHASVADVPLLTGEGMVLIPKTGARPRLLLSFKDTQETIFEKKPVSNFTKEFLKLYKKANKK